MAEAIDHLTCLRALRSAENDLSLTGSYILLPSQSEAMRSVSSIRVHE